MEFLVMQLNHERKLPHPRMQEEPMSNSLTRLSEAEFPRLL